MIQDILQRCMPDFLGIGAQRAGTTWLWNNLRVHPEIWMPRTKEKHFFDIRFSNSILPLLPKKLEAQLRYSTHFIKGQLMRKKVGEFTPAYAILSPEKISIIQAWMPEVQLIYIMRDPVERAWSQAKKSFENETNTSLKQADSSQLKNFFQRNAVIERGNYHKCLQRWFDQFERDSFFIGFTSEFSRNPAEFLQDVYQFLSVEEQFIPPEKNLKTPAHKTEEIPIPPDIKEFLKESFYKQNQQLSDLIDRELPWS